MPAYANNLKTEGELWLSGFYQEDIAYLIQTAEQVGLTHIETQNTNEWQWLRLKK
jgi:ribosomal protein L11 methyltransferase